MDETALTPSQSATRRSPGLPAIASAFSVVWENDVVASRRPCLRSGRERPERALEERLLELDLLQVLGLHRPELSHRA